MSKKNNSAIIKRDTLGNWEKATKYIPKENVIIIVDKPDGTVELRIGDGTSLVNDLPDILKMDIKGPSSYVDGNEILVL